MSSKNVTYLFVDELKRYTIAERILFLANVVLAIAIMVLSNQLIQTQFGRASLTFGMVMLGVVAILKVLRKWGPE